MSMVHCQECNQPVSTKARKCPHCGTEQPVPGLANWHLLVAFLITIGPTIVLVLLASAAHHLAGLAAVLFMMAANYGVMKLLALLFPRQDDRKPCLADA